MIVLSNANLFSLCVVLFVIAASNDSQTTNIVRIYSNLAEIIEPLGQDLPLEFTADQWVDMRVDSITLLGANIISQTITEKKKSMAGTQIYLRWPPFCITQLPEAILVDETTRLVKVHHGNKSDFIFYRLTYDEQIVYLNEEPPTSKVYVDFA